MIEKGKHDFERGPYTDVRKRDHLLCITIVCLIFDT